MISKAFELTRPCPGSSQSIAIVNAVGSSSSPGSAEESKGGGAGDVFRLRFLAVGPVEEMRRLVLGFEELGLGSGSGSSEIVKRFLFFLGRCPSSSYSDALLRESLDSPSSTETLLTRLLCRVVAFGVVCKSSESESESGSATMVAVEEEVAGGGGGGVLSTSVEGGSNVGGSESQSPGFGLDCRDSRKRGGSEGGEAGRDMLIDVSSSFSVELVTNGA